jgi:hypothetical protein
MQEHIQYDFLQDGHFAALKEAELLNDRIQTLDSIQSYIGTFFSKKWVLKNVLRMNDGDIDNMQKQIDKEAGIPPDEGGVDVPSAGDGITRYPMDKGGAVIDPAQLAAFDDLDNLPEPKEKSEE